MRTSGALSVLREGQAAFEDLLSRRKTLLWTAFAGLPLEARDQPGSGGTRRRVGGIDRIEPVGAAGHVGQVEPDQAPEGEVFLDHRKRHVAPTNASLEQH